MLLFGIILFALILLFAPIIEKYSPKVELIHSYKKYKLVLWYSKDNAIGETERLCITLFEI